MSKDPYFKKKVGDWTFSCSVCGMKGWGSEAVRLGVYTGHGGAVCHPECVYEVDYGLVPYKIPSEAPVPFSQDAFHTNDPSQIGVQVAPFDFSTQDPCGPGPAPAPTPIPSSDD